MKELLPGVLLEMLDPRYWLSQITDTATWSADATNTWYEQSGELYKLTRTAAFEFVLPTRSSKTLYNQHGHEIDARQWDEIESLSRIRPCQPTPGVTLRLTDVRRWPTITQAFRTAADREFDQFQDTTLHTLDAVVIIGETANGQWLYVYATTYRGFVAANDITTTTWATLEALGRIPAAAAVVVTAPYTRTQPQPYDLDVSTRPVEFAAVLPHFDAVAALGDDQLPLAPDASSNGAALGRQSQIGHRCVAMPVRNTAGKLELRPAYIPAADVHEGWLPCTRETILRHAFSLLYERYGWGGRLGVHDCSSFIMDVYRLVGVQMPRDTGNQETALPTKVTFHAGQTSAQRRELLSQLQPGDALYMPGHTMLYIGSSAGQPYVLHDFAGYVVGEETIPVNQVLVSTLDIRTSRGTTYLQSLTSGGAVMVR